MVSPSPRQAGLYAPPEWSPQRSSWLAWPTHRYAWGAHLEAAQAEFVALVHALLDAGEQLELLVPDDAGEAEARAALGAPDPGPRIHHIAYGDIWLRDTGPMFLGGKEDSSACVFGFNGWGEKYRYPHDEQVADAMAASRGSYVYRFPLVLEGGAVELDGNGLCLTTRQVLLNRNRNPGRSEAQLETTLRDALGVEQVLWLEAGLKHDHTDGHVDNVARFTAAGCVAYMQASDNGDDPNGQRLRDIEGELRRMLRRGEQPLTLHGIPAPGEVRSTDGEPLPASYLNYYLGNHVLVVPAFGRPNDEAAARALGALYPDRTTLSLSARALLEGGGAFHCITKQEPA